MYFFPRCSDYLHLFLNLERGEVNENSDYDIELCGNISTLNQKTYYSRGRSLVLEFHSDPTKNLTFTGFKGIFKFLDARDFVSSCQKELGTQCSYTCPSNPGNSIGNNKFFSPRFPQNYPHSSTCHYQFLGQEGEKVRIHFQTIQLYNNENLPCDKAKDYIEVHDGLDRTHPTIRQYCGTGGVESRVVTSKGPFMFVIFSSNDFNHQKGFVASYDFISKHTTLPYTTSPYQDDAIVGEESEGAVFDVVCLSASQLLPHPHPQTQPHPHPHPNLTPNLTPTHTPNLTPTHTPNLTPNLTPTHTPNLTPNLTPTHTPNLTPTHTPTSPPPTHPTSPPPPPPASPPPTPQTSPPPTPPTSPPPTPPTHTSNPPSGVFLPSPVSPLL
ncbi:neuropilin-1-like [Pecten maximus]|uniref:neuropilin-1-like n=1 Tax=Pecten maximus TaxID=6579 RepID=UPI001458CE9F|nr:neuropilin-1-like [Pecten maximus]